MVHQHQAVSASPILNPRPSAANSACTFSNFRIETANNFAVASQAGSANRFLNNVISPRTTPFPGTGRTCTNPVLPCMHGRVL